MSYNFGGGSSGSGYTPSGVAITGGTIDGAVIGGVNPKAGTFTNLLGNVTATGSTTGRSLANRFADILNVKDFGAKLDGTTNDVAAFQAAIDACPDQGTIIVPAGGFNVTGSLTNPSNKDIRWVLNGNNFLTGSVPVVSVINNTMVETYSNRKVFRKTFDDSGSKFALVEMTLDNKTTDSGTAGVHSNLYMSTTSEAGCGGYTWGINGNLFSKSTGGLQQDVCIASSVWRTGSCPTWQYFGQTVDKTGVPPNTQSSIVGFEMDITCNGPENSSTAFNPGMGGRVCLEFVNRSYDPPIWTATTTYAVGDVITASPTNGFTYVCTVGGTSGSTQPTFPTSAGTVSDGTVTWSFGTTIACQISRCIDMSTDSNTQLGTGLYANSTFYNAVLDFTGSTLTGTSPAGIRLTANMPIDFSANGTLAGQNIRTLGYDGTALSYSKSGSSVFRIADAGQLAIGGSSFGVGIGINVLGSWTTGLTFANATIAGSAIVFAGGNTLAWEVTNVRKTGYSGGFVIDYNNTTQIRKLDSSGNETLTGSITSVGRVNSGSVSEHVTIFTTTGNYTATSTDNIIVIKKTTGAATQVTLPSSPATGRMITVKDGKGDSSTNNITITPASGTIDGAASIVLNVNYASVDLIFDGTNWGVI